MRASSRLLIPLLSGALGAGCTGSTQGHDTSNTSPSDTASDTATTPTAVWQDVHLDTSEAMTGAFSSGSGLYVTLTGGTTEVRSNNSWTAIPIDVPDTEDLNGLWGAGTGSNISMVAVGTSGYVASWLNGGWSVEDIGTANLLSVSGKAPQHLMAVGWGGLYTYTAAPESPAPKPDTGSDDTGSGSGSGDTGGGDTGGVEYGWVYQALDNNPKLNDIWYDGSNAFAVGEDGAIAIFDGSNWSITQDPDLRTFHGVAATGPDDAWAVGEGGAIMHWDGTHWVDSDSGHTESLWSVWAYSTTDVFVVGSNGVALRWDGTQWTDLPTGVDNNLYRVTGTTPSNVWAVGNRGMTLHYTGG